MGHGHHRRSVRIFKPLTPVAHGTSHHRQIWFLWNALPGEVAVPAAILVKVEEAAAVVGVSPRSYPPVLFPPLCLSRSEPPVQQVALAVLAVMEGVARLVHSPRPAVVAANDLEPGRPAQGVLVTEELEELPAFLLARAAMARAVVVVVVVLTLVTIL